MADNLQAAQGLSSNNTENNRTIEETAIPIIQYTLILEQFTPEQHTKFRAFYMQYSGYSHHEIVSQHSTDAVVTYMSNAPIDLLVNNFSKTADYLGMQVLVRHVNQTISIRLIKLQAKSLPYKDW